MRWTVAVLLLCACSSPAIAEPRPVRPLLVEIPDARVEALANMAPEPEPEPELAPSIPVAQAVAHRPPPYRNARYIARCRRESRSDAPEVERVESKPEARHRARQAARAGELDEVLVLARIAHGETGTPRPGTNDDEATPLWDEAEAILAVLDERRGGMSRVEMFVNYSPRRVYPHPEDVRQQWIAELQLDGRRPPSWPRPRQRRFHNHPAWRTWGCPRWLATVDAVHRVLEAHPRRIERGPCEETPDHWGGAAGIDDHPLRLGWRRIDCGITRNRFWAVPQDGA